MKIFQSPHAVCFRLSITALGVLGLFTQAVAQSDSVHAHPALPAGTELAIAGYPDADVCYDGGGTTVGPGGGSGGDWTCEIVELRGARSPVLFTLPADSPVRVEGARWVHYCAQGGDKTSKLECEWVPLQAWSP